MPPTYYDPVRIGLSDLRVCVNNFTNAYSDATWNPFVSVGQVELHKPGAQATTVQLQLDAAQAHKHAGSLARYRLEDGDNVKLYQYRNSAWEIIWQGFIDDPKSAWRGTTDGWQSGQAFTAADYRAMLARVPFRTAAQVTHLWKLVGTDTFETSGGDITFTPNVLANGTEEQQNDIGRGFGIRFNAKQQFDDAVPVSGNQYQDVTDTGETDPTGAGKWFYINRTVPELLAYIIRNSGAEITRALPAGVSLVFDDSYSDIPGTFIPDEIALPDGTSVLDALKAVIETTGTWTCDINPSYLDEEGNEIHQPQLVFFDQSDTTHQYRAWWAGPDAAADATVHAYNLLDWSKLAVRKSPAANRIIGIVTGGGQFVSDTMSYPALRNRSSQPSLSVTDNEDVWTTKPGSADYVRTYQHNGRIVSGYVKVCTFSAKTIIKSATENGATKESLEYANYGASRYHLEGYRKTNPEVTWTSGNTTMLLLVKPETQVLSLQLGPKTTNKATGSTYTHKATLKCKSYTEFAESGKKFYLLTRIGTPKFLFDKRARRHRTDRDDATGKQPGDPDFNPTPFGIIPSERYFFIDTLLPETYEGTGAIPVLDMDAPGEPESYCTEYEIDNVWSDTAPWRTGTGTSGSGRVITDMDFIQVPVSGLRFDSNGAMDTASLARWNAAIVLCRAMVKARFDQRSTACTDGDVTIMHDAVLTRAHIDLAAAGVLTPLQLRVNLCTGAPTGTNFERWQSMAALILKLDLSPGGEMTATLNDTPVIPGVPTRRARLPQRKIA